MSVLKVWRKSVHIWWSYFTKCAIFKFPKFCLYMHVSIVELACDNQFLKLSHGHNRSYWTKHCYELSNHINHIFWHHGCVRHHESHGNDGSHAYDYSEIKQDIPIFWFRPNFRHVVLVWAQGFTPHKNHLEKRMSVLKVLKKSVHIWLSYVTKCAIFKFPKFHLYMHGSIVELACDN